MLGKYIPTFDETARLVFIMNIIMTHQNKTKKEENIVLLIIITAVNPTTYSKRSNNLTY